MQGTNGLAPKLEAGNPNREASVAVLAEGESNRANSVSLPGEKGPVEDSVAMLKAGRFKEGGAEMELVVKP